MSSPINDPNHDNVSDFSKITRENTGLFGVPSTFEASVSHVSHGEFSLQGEIQNGMHRETVARQRDREEEREGSDVKVSNQYMPLLPLPPSPPSLSPQFPDDFPHVQL